MGVPRESVTVPLITCALNALAPDDAESVARNRTTTLTGIGQWRLPVSTARDETVKAPSPSGVRID
jgi:hypothetical protein